MVVWCGWCEVMLLRRREIKCWRDADAECAGLGVWGSEVARLCWGLLGTDDGWTAG